MMFIYIYKRKLEVRLFHVYWLVFDSSIFFKQNLDWLKYQIVLSLACRFTVLFISNVVKFSTGGSPPGARVNIVKEVDQSFSLMCAVV